MMTETVRASSTTVTSTFVFESSRIFRDKELFEVDHVPDSLLHRSPQVAEINEILADTIRPYNIVCLGGFGTGKTATVRRIGQDLPSGYRLVYVSCSRANTQTRVLTAMLAELATPRSWLPLDKFRELVEGELKKHRYVILVLDEVDQFLQHRDSEVDAFFYILSRMSEWRNVVAILLSNRVDLEPLLRKHLDPRTLDTFRWRRCEFGDYCAAELGDILEARCKLGLRDSAWDKGIVAKIALISYNQGLGARGCIDIVREAGLIAEREQRGKITENDVLKASSVDEHMQVIQSLTPIDKAVARFIFAKGRIQTRELHGSFYPKVAQMYGGGQSLDVCQRHIQRLVTFGIMVQEQTGRGKKGGKGSETWLSIAPDMVSAVKKSLEGIDPTARCESLEAINTCTPQ